jgi:KDO2-lipid IV(A) lauroyltransferase
MARPRSRFRNLAEELALELLRRASAAASLEAAEEAGRRLGRLYRHLDARRRRLVRTNLSQAFPERTPHEIEELSRAVFAHFGGIVADLLRSLDEPVEKMTARVEIRGEQFARAAASSKRGFFFLASHFGNWEFGALVAARLGFPMTVIARPLDNTRLETRLRAFRARAGNTVLPKAEAAREILRILRHGGSVGVLADQHARGPDAVIVPFFGRPASTTSAIARIADRTEALILPADCVRTRPGRYLLTFRETVDVRLLPPEERAPVPLTARINRVIEAPIREHPEQWLWLHNRWRLGGDAPGGSEKNNALTFRQGV